MKQEINSSNVVKFPKTNKRLTTQNLIFKDKGALMRTYQTCEELKKELTGKHGCSIKTLQDVLKTCREHDKPRLHQKLDVLDKIREHLSKNGISFYYPKETSFSRNQDSMSSEDPVYVYIKESRSGKVLDIILNALSIKSDDQPISDNLKMADELIRDIGKNYFLPNNPCDFS